MEGSAAMNWSDENWKKAARDYHKARAGKALVVETEEKHLAFLRRLMADNVSLDAAYNEINCGAARAEPNPPSKFWPSSYAPGHPRCATAKHNAASPSSMKANSAKSAIGCERNAGGSPTPGNYRRGCRPGSPRKSRP
jgi:hypothetical protein